MATKKNFSKSQRALLGSVFIGILLTLVYTSSVLTIARARENSAITLPEDYRFEVTGITDTTVSLAWDAVTEADSYSIYKWKPGDPDWSLLVNTNGTSYTDGTDFILNCDNPAISYGDYYKLVAYDYDTSSFAETGWIPGAPLNDDFNKAIDITAVPGTVNLDTCNANRSTNFDDPEISDCNMNKGLSTVWYMYTEGPSDAAISFDTKGADYDTFIAVWTGDLTNYLAHTLTPVACNNDTGGTSQSAIAFQTTANETYYIEIGQYTGTTGTSAASVVDTTLGPPESERAK